jgi:hypothetical protein
MSRVSDGVLKELIEEAQELVDSTPDSAFTPDLLAFKELAELRAQNKWVKVAKDFEPDYGSIWLVRCIGKDGLPWTDIATYSMMGGWCIGSGKEEGVSVTHIREFPEAPSDPIEVKR